MLPDQNSELKKMELWKFHRDTQSSNITAILLQRNHNIPPECWACGNKGGML